MLADKYRELRFIVDGQSIKKDPRCDFSGIVSGTKNYLVAVFSFSKDWKDIKMKVAEFSILDDKFVRVILNNKCMIPNEALLWNSFNVRVIGSSQDDMVISTDKTVVLQQFNSIRFNNMT